MTVAENVVMGNPPYKGRLVDLRKSEELVRQLSEEYGLVIDPKARVKDLTVGLQQRVEILKALYLGAEILIMDEPTAVLTPQEILQLRLQSFTDHTSISSRSHVLSAARRCTG